jgi:protein-S-isoprenylcysteine O-methyltransferase Ste14
MAATIDSPDNPGVIAPPPLIYLVALVVGILAQLVVPFHLFVPTAVRWIGAALIPVAFALAMFARTSFVRAGTSPNPYKPVVALVTHGPFKFSRNPMYVAFALLYLGIILVMRNGWLLVLLPVTMVLMHLGVILREEQYLGRKFGEEYRMYRGRVRRYF